ncbi:MAG TPA: threonine synthase [Treponemataceae bacterium]|nr:threonine synthase [Treponemataceae bacterium]
MELVSTRNAEKKVSFRNAVLDCIPQDGGLFVPAREEDLRPWVLYMDENTKFSSIAGTLTSALLKEEFSPVVSERIAAAAFDSYSPELRQLDERTYSLELYHGPTGSHKDFGLLWFASALEHILTMEDRTSVVMAATSGLGGRSMAAAFAGKKRLKMILVFPKGSLVGLDPSVLAWNGGNILPVEVDGDLLDAKNLVRDMYKDRSIVEKYGLTLANTMNIGRLLPQVFFYMFAFTRLRRKVRGDIFYAVPSGNYGNLVAGLYAWKFSLPVNGFITDATAGFSCDATGRCSCLDSMVPLMRRGPADPASPSNLERLEQVFEVNPLMLRGLVFPAEVKPDAISGLMFDAWKKYGVMLDSATAAAYGASFGMQDRINSDEGTVVLVSKDHPAFESDKLRVACGQSPEQPDFLKLAREPIQGARLIAKDKSVLESILKDFA